VAADRVPARGIPGHGLALMLVLVSDDVEVTSPGGARRLRRVPRACQDYGQRVQFSPFEIGIPPDQWVLLRARLAREIDPTRDSYDFTF
jgi:CRISPR-associated protein Cas2